MIFYRKDFASLAGIAYALARIAQVRDKVIHAGHKRAESHFRRSSPEALHEVLRPVIDENLDKEEALRAYGT